MKTTRFEIKCLDGVWRYVFCRSLTGADPQTGTAVVATERKQNAYCAYSDEQARKDLDFFTEKSHGGNVRFAMNPQTLSLAVCANG